jgi:hypothetical protein
MSGTVWPHRRCRPGTRVSCIGSRAIVRVLYPSRSGPPCRPAPARARARDSDCRTVVPSNLMIKATASLGEQASCRRRGPTVGWSSAHRPVGPCEAASRSEATTAAPNAERGLHWTTARTPQRDCSARPSRGVGADPALGRQTKHHRPAHQGRAGQNLSRAR